jgi:hypothetical protein
LSIAGIGVVIIIVVCVAFLLFMIVLGVMRIRSAHQRGPRDVPVDGERQEMEWDNSALTITVNPMDQEVSPSLLLFRAAQLECGQSKDAALSEFLFLHIRRVKQIFGPQPFYR